MKLNIFFIASNYPPRIGGPATTVPKIAKELSKTENITVIAFHEKGTKWIQKKDFILKRSPSFYSFGFSNPISVIVRTGLISLFTRINAIFDNPSLIHAHDAHISAIAAIFTKYTSLKKRIIITKYAGDLTVEFSGLQNNKGQSIEEIIKNPSKKQKTLLFIQKAIFNLSDYIQVQNEYQKSILKSFYNINSKKIIVVPNPVDLTQFFTSKSTGIKKKYVILMVSRLVPWKGHETAIKAIKLVQDKIKNCELRIIGEGEEEYKQKLFELSRKLEVEDKIQFCGKKYNANLQKEYALADLFLQPSFYEPFGITVVEALACGKPVIASKIGGLPELIKEGKNGFLFSAGNEKELSEKIIKASKQKFIINQKEISKNFSIKNCTNLLKESYQNILSNLK